MATSACARRHEPCYKQHTAVDDARGVVLDVAVTTGAVSESRMIEAQVDAVRETTRRAIGTVTADAGYAYAKVFGGLERRRIDPVIPTRKDPSRSPVPLSRFRYDARHHLVMLIQAAASGLGAAIGRPMLIAHELDRRILVPLFERQQEAPERCCLITTPPRLDPARGCRVAKQINYLYKCGICTHYGFSLVGYGMLPDSLRLVCFHQPAPVDGTAVSTIGPQWVALVPEGQRQDT